MTAGGSRYQGVPSQVSRLGSNSRAINLRPCKVEKDEKYKTRAFHPPFRRMLSFLCLQNQTWQLASCCQQWKACHSDGMLLSLWRHQYHELFWMQEKIHQGHTKPGGPARIRTSASATMLNTMKVYMVVASKQAGFQEPNAWKPEDTILTMPWYKWYYYLTK